MAEMMLIPRDYGMLVSQPPELIELDPFMQVITEIHSGAQTAAEVIYDGMAETVDAVKNGIDNASELARRHPRIATLVLAGSLAAGIGLDANAIHNASVASRSSTATTTQPLTVDTAQAAAQEAQILEKVKKAKVAGYGGAAAGAVLVGGAILNKINGFNPFDWAGKKLPPPPKYHPAQPGQVAEALHEETVEITETIEVECNTKMSGAVGAKGDSPGGTIHFDAHVDKLYTVDGVLCGTLEVPIKITKSSLYGITKIEGIFPTLVPSFPSINERSAENSVNAKHDTSVADFKAMVAKYKADKASGKKVDFYGGHWHDTHWNQLIALDNPYEAGLQASARTGAMIAWVLDVKNENLIAPRQADFEKQFLKFIRGTDGYVPGVTVLDFKKAKLTDDQVMALRVESASDLLKDFQTINPNTDITTDKKGMRTLKLVATDGQKVFITLTGDWNITDKKVFVPKLKPETVVETIVNPDGTTATVPYDEGVQTASNGVTSDTTGNTGP